MDRQSRVATVCGLHREVVFRWLTPASCGRVPLVIEVGTRRRNQPAPPHVLFEALTNPDRDLTRVWLVLLQDERRPEIVESDEPRVVVWSSLWTHRPDARIRFELPRDQYGFGTDLRWTLLVDEPVPDASLQRDMCRRLNVLINANLRYTFGQ